MATVKKIYITLIIQLTALSLFAQNIVEHLQNLNNITKILIDKDKSVWAGNTAGYILHFNKDGKLLEQFFLEDKSITGLVQSQNGILFATTFSNFYAFKNGKWVESTFVEKPMLEINITESNVGNSNTVWVKSEDNTLYKFFNNEWKIYNSVLKEEMSILFEDNGGNQWFNKSNDLYRFINDSFELMYNVNSADFGKIINETCMSDSKGNKWFGTEKGILKNTDKEWVFYTKSDTEEFGGIKNIFEDKFGTMWAICKNGSFSYVDSTWKIKSWVNYENKFIDSKGKIWMFGYKDNIMVYDGVRFYNSAIPDTIIKVNNVYAIAQIEDILYFGTDKGLVQYDGNKWQNYFQQEPITKLFTDNDYNLWINLVNQGVFKRKYKNTEFIKQNDYFFPSKQTSNGLLWENEFYRINYFEPKINKFTRLANFPIPQTVLSDNKNNLYLYCEGIYRLENEVWEKIEKYNYRKKGINDIFIDSKNNIWIAHLTVLNKFDAVTKEWKYDIQTSINNNYLEVFQTIEDSEYNIWLNTSFGFIKNNGGNWESKNNFKSTRNENISIRYEKENRIFNNESNNLRFISPSYGLFKLENDIWKLDTTLINQLAYFSGNIAQDKNYYFISSKNGLLKINGTKYTNFKHENSLPNNNVTALLIDSKERLWIGSEVSYLLSNLHSYFNDIWTKHNNSNTFFSDIYDFFEDSKGNIFVGNRANGISKFNGNSWQNINTNNTTTNKVYCFLEDSKKNIWVGHHGGLSKFDGQKWTLMNHLLKSKDFVTEKMVIAQMGVFKILEDKKGVIWGGTDGGLIKIDKEGVKILNNKNSVLPTNFIENLLQDHDGNILIHSRQKLYLFNENEIKSIKLPNYDVATFSQDKGNNIFLVTTNGIIFQLIGNQWTQVLKTGINGLSITGKQPLSSFVVTPNYFWISTRGNGVYKIKR